MKSGWWHPNWHSKEYWGRKVLLQEWMLTVWKIYTYIWESHGTLDELQQVRNHYVGKANNCMSQDQRSSWNVRGNCYMSLEERFFPLWKACTGCRMQPAKEKTACPKNVGRLLLERLGKQAAAQRSHCTLACEGDLQHEVSNWGKLPQEPRAKERFIYFVWL